MQAQADGGQLAMAGSLDLHVISTNVVRRLEAKPTDGAWRNKSRPPGQAMPNRSNLSTRRLGRDDGILWPVLNGVYYPAIEVPTQPSFTESEWVNVYALWDRYNKVYFYPCMCPAAKHCPLRKRSETVDCAHKGSFIGHQLRLHSTDLLWRLASIGMTIGEVLWISFQSNRLTFGGGVYIWCESKPEARLLNTASTKCDYFCVMYAGPFDTLRISVPGLGRV